jgi:hypothetical protein
MIVEAKRSSQFSDVYPGGSIRLSLRTEQDNTLKTEPVTPGMRFGVHVVYLGTDDRYFEDIHADEIPYGELVRKNDYDETLAHYDVPNPVAEYSTPQVIWVSNRQQQVEIDNPIEKPDDKRIRMIRKAEEPTARGLTVVKNGIELIEALEGEHGVDPYDVSYLTGGVRRTARPKGITAGVDRVLARGADRMIRNSGKSGVRENDIQRIIRVVAQ